MSQGYETHSVGNMANNDVVPVYGKLGNQPWIFIGRTEAEAPILWPPDVKSWITGKDPNAVQDWGQGEKGATEDEMVGWHHRLNGHEFEQTPGDSEGQRSLVSCSPWSRKESDTTQDWTLLLSYEDIHLAVCKQMNMVVYQEIFLLPAGYNGTSLWV